MQIKDVQIVLVDWIERNIISVLPQDSWQRFIACAALPEYTRKMLDKLSSNDVLSIFDVDTGINIDKLEELAEIGFQRQPKIKLSQIPLIGETFWLKKENVIGLIEELRNFGNHK